LIIGTKLIGSDSRGETTRSMHVVHISHNFWVRQVGGIAAFVLGRITGLCK
jgi:hypothetical protein